MAHSRLTVVRRECTVTGNGATCGSFRDVEAEGISDSRTHCHSSVLNPE